MENVYDHLLEKAQQGEISGEEVHFISQALQQALTKKDDDNLPYLIHILGLSGAEDNRQLVEKFLIYPDYPLASKEALRTLCRYWLLTPHYLDQIKMFIKGVEWDVSDEVRISAIFIAGEYLREHFDRTLLELLLTVFEDLGKTEKVFENRPYARNLLRACAYEAIARAMGMDWDELPEDVYDWEEEKWDLFDLNLIQEAHQKVIFDSLLEKARQGQITGEEVLFVSQALEKALSKKEDVYLPHLIHILGLTGASENRQLVEKFLIYPHFPPASEAALVALCRDWLLTPHYLDQIKMFIKGVEWDSTDQVRISAIFIAGEYLRNHFERTLLELLLLVFENLGKTEKILEHRSFFRPIIRGVAFYAIALAMGREEDELPDPKDIEERIEQEQWDLLDLNPIREAHQKLL